MLSLRHFRFILVLVHDPLAKDRVAIFNHCAMVHWSATKSLACVLWQFGGASFVLKATGDSNSCCLGSVPYQL